MGAANHLMLPPRGSCREATEGVQAPGGWRSGLQPPPPFGDLPLRGRI